VAFLVEEPQSLKGKTLRYLAYFAWDKRKAHGQNTRDRGYLCSRGSGNSERMTACTKRI
jgi:hypothetical protein